MSLPHFKENVVREALCVGSGKLPENSPPDMASYTLSIIVPPLFFLKPDFACNEKSLIKSLKTSSVGFLHLHRDIARIAACHCALYPSQSFSSFHVCLPLGKARSLLLFKAFLGHHVIPTSGGPNRKKYGKVQSKLDIYIYIYIYHEYQMYVYIYIYCMYVCVYMYTYVYIYTYNMYIYIYI